MSKTGKVTNLNVVKKNSKNYSKVSALSPREIVSELDRYVIGQKEAKKAVAVALRNRWRRQALSDEMRDEVLPKNILMIGPTGVGKTEISRRLSKLAQAPFIKVEATRFTEVGYVGRDVEQIIRDLIEIAIAMEKERKRKEVKAKAELKAEELVLDALVGNKATVATRESFRKRLRNGDLDGNEIEIEVQGAAAGLQSFEIPGMPGGNVGMVNLGDILGKSIGNKKGKKKKMSVKESHDILIAQESDKMIEEDKIIKEAKKSTEENGIVFLDEIDKVSARSDRVCGDVSREGVQRDLLPLIEGTTVSTKHGPIKTDHILFIASGAFQLAKPSHSLRATKRMIHWNTDSSKLRNEGVPGSFEFKAGAIFITNIKFDHVKSKKLQDHLAALESRCHYIDLQMDTEREKVLRIKQIVKDGMLESYEFKNGEQDEVINFIDDQKKKLRELSLRTVLKIADLRKSFPNNWKEMAEVTVMKTGRA